MTHDPTIEQNLGAAGEPDGFATNPAEARLRRYLDASASQIDLGPAQPEQVMSRGVQRTVRRRRLVAGGALAAASVGTIVGIQQLSATEPTSISTSQDIVTDESGSSVDADDVVPEDGAQPVPQPSADTVVVAEQPSNATAPVAVVGDGEAVDAQLTESPFVWRVVEPDKDAAISSTFDSQSRGFPTFAVSTAPGRSNDYDNVESVVWRTEDGISWTQTGLASPFGTQWWSSTAADQALFAVGTAPGIAVTEVNPLQVAHSTGGEWDFIDLPLDTNDLADIEGLFSNMQTASTRFGDGLLVSATLVAQPDTDRLASHIGVAPSKFWIVDQNTDGMTLADPECDLDGQSSPIDSIFEDVPARSASEPNWYGDCELIDFTWQELGLSDEAIAAVAGQTTRFFDVGSDLSVTEIPGPPDGGFLYPGDTDSPDRPLFFQATWSGLGTATTYELVEGEWVTGEADERALFGRRRVTLGDVSMSFSEGFGQALLRTESNGLVTNADLAGLFEADSMLSQNTTPTGTDTHWVGAVTAWPDSVARAGGIETTVGDVTIRRETIDGSLRLVDSVSGAAIPRSSMTSDEQGNVVVADADGGVRAEFNIDDVYFELDQLVDYNQDSAHHRLLTTADGLNFSVESVSELLGVDDDAVRSVSRLSSDGTTVIVAVTMNERHPDDTAKQLVLVGTPVG